MSDAALWLGRLSSEIGSWASSPRAPVSSAEAAAGAIMGAWFELTSEAAAMARRIGDGDAEARLYRMRDGCRVLPSDDLMQEVRDLLGLGTDATLRDVADAVESLVGQRDRLRALRGDA